MKKFTLRFMAKERGAIGAFQSFIETVEAETYAAARLSLYDNYDHITVFEVNGCAVTAEQR